MELTTRQAATRLGVPPARARALIATGGLTARRVGTLWLIDSASVEHQRGLTSAGYGPRDVPANRLGGRGPRRRWTRRLAQRYRTLPTAPPTLWLP